MHQLEEVVDLVDDNGKIIERNIPRSEIDRFPKLHLQIIIAVIFNEHGRVLVHQRSKTKKVNPGDIDHVCGGIKSGETPEEASAREAFEETGVRPTELQILSKGINIYNRFRFLLIGTSNETPIIVDPTEAEWTDFMSIEELREKERSGELTFVDEFFEDTLIADHYRTTNAPVSL